MPPLERPMAWLEVPLLRPGRGDAPSRWWRPPSHTPCLAHPRRLEQPRPDIVPHPVAEARVDRVPLPEPFRDVAPGTARAHHPQHRFHEAPVVLATATRITRLAQTVRFHLRPLGVRQYVAFHRELESHAHP